MNFGIIYLSIVIIVLLFLFSRQLLKAQGFFNYTDPKENEIYHNWLEKERVPKTILSIIVIIFLLSVWVWSFTFMWR